MHWYHLKPLACRGALLLLSSLSNLKIKKTIRIVNCIKIIGFRVDMFRIAFEDQLVTMLVGDQSDYLIAQLGQESARSVWGSRLDNDCIRSENTYRINVARFLEITPAALSSQVVSSGQKMMYTRSGWRCDALRRYNPGRRRGCGTALAGQGGARRREALKDDECINL